MAAQGSYTTDDALPLATLRARGRDKNWMADGLCRGHELQRKRAWVIEPTKIVTLSDGARIRGSQLIASALAVCRNCPVQWDCTKWAIEVYEQAGTWGVAFADLEWLRDITRPGVQIVEAARFRSIPVQVAVSKARAVMV